MPRLLRFQDQHPEITVRLETTTTVVDLVRDGVDVAIRFSGEVKPGLRDEVLFAEEVIPVCSPGLVAERPLHEPSDLRKHTLIHLEGESADRSWPDWETWLRAADVDDIDVSRGLRFTQTMTAAQAAKDGQGVALLGRTCLIDDLAARRLVQPLSLGFPTAYEYRVVSTEAAFDLPKVRNFREWLRMEVAASLQRVQEVKPPVERGSSGRS